MVTKTKLLSGILFLFVLTFYVACRKTDTNILGKEPSREQQGEKFFNQHRTNDPIEKSVIEFLKRFNTKSKFVQQTIKQIGYPHWDKAMTFCNQHIQSRNSTSDSLNILFVPFVRNN
jgi:hypothetical protein